VQRPQIVVTAPLDRDEFLPPGAISNNLRPKPNGAISSAVPWTIRRGAATLPIREAESNRYVPEPRQGQQDEVTAVAEEIREGG